MQGNDADLEKLRRLLVQVDEITKKNKWPIALFGFGKREGAKPAGFGVIRFDPNNPEQMEACVGLPQIGNPLLGAAIARAGSRA